MAEKTALYQQHLQANAKMVDFGGWEMPLHYGSQLDEHHQVRQDAGMFDVSHMTIIDVSGAQSQDFLRYLLANNVDRLAVDGKALYSCMLNEAGNVIDDLIVYKQAEQRYRVVVNAATRVKDLAWINQQAEQFNVTINERSDLAMLAIQGPNARSKVKQALDAEFIAIIDELKPFYSKEIADWMIAHTGYTGEDGLEIMLPNTQAETLWHKFINAGIKPCGLGARDTLRLEAGMNLYGTDMDETTSPLTSGLGWTIAWEPTDRDFIGRKALQAQRQQGVTHKFVGLILDGKGVLRNHQKVILANGEEGEITSGSYSPTLSKAIGLARVPKTIGAHCEVMIRNKAVPASVVKVPFVRHGKPVYKLIAEGVSS